MQIVRTLPPTAAPLGAIDCWNGFSALFRGGRAARRLETELRSVLGSRHVFPVSSGKAALTLVLRALGAMRGQRREVVIPAYTCYSVPAAIVKAGLKVTPVDIDAETLDFNYDLLRRTVGPATLCIVPDHLFGRPAVLDALVGLAREQGAFLVEDAAQALGVDSAGRKLGTVGDAGIFSFGRGKNVTCGSGGLIVTDSDEIAAALGTEMRKLPAASPLAELLGLLEVALMAAFVKPALYWLPAALPFLGLGETRFPRDFPIRRLSGMRAGLLARVAGNLARGNAARREHVDYYVRNLPGARRADASLPLLRFPVLVEDPGKRERILAGSRRRGLGIGTLYPGAVDEIPELRPLVQGGGCPVARQVARRLITLPTHHLATRADLEEIVGLLCS